jgi:hypothetical protein
MSDVENEPLLEGHTHRFPDSDLFWRMMSDAKTKINEKLENGSDE